MPERTWPQVGEVCRASHANGREFSGLPRVVTYHNCKAECVTIRWGIPNTDWVVSKAVVYRVGKTERDKIMGVGLGA